MIEKREFEIPKTLELIIEKGLKQRGVALSEAKKIAEAALYVSDYYLHNPADPTPWNESITWIGQLAYYLPLNYLRNLSVFRELKKWIDLNSFHQLIDYGTGLGASCWAARDSGFKGQLLQFDSYSLLKDTWSELPSIWLNTKNELYQNITPDTLGVFSYSLTEQDDPLSIIEKFSTLVLIEPSTHQDARRLQKFRQLLIENDYFIVTPCTHQLGCPLLIHSEKDWCHDRIHFKKPQWFERIESYLPMKNETLTFSYLIVVKKSSSHFKTLKKSEPVWKPIDSENKNSSPQPLVGRLTGDLLVEKGKSRQLFCTQEQRTFLAWLHRYGEAPEIGRGQSLRIHGIDTLTSNEYRIFPDYRLEIQSSSKDKDN